MYSKQIMPFDTEIYKRKMQGDEEGECAVFIFISDAESAKCAYMYLWKYNGL